MKDYYDILGLSSDASEEDIKRSYRILAHQYHPDKKDGNEKRFKDINNAYRILSNASSRAEFDQNLKNAQAKTHFDTEQSAEPSKTHKGLSRKRHWQIVIGIVLAGALLYIISGGSGNQTTSTGVTSVNDSSVQQPLSSGTQFAGSDSSSGI
jgi:DnaJ-class molecular chaperone